MDHALVVGLGRMGGFHRKVLTDLGYITTTVDPNPSAEADHASVNDVDVARFDVAVVATPPESLYLNASILAAYRVPRLYVEKPFCATMEHARALAELVEDSPVCVGFVERFNPQVALIRKLTRFSLIRHVRFVRWSDRPSWDLRLDLALHDLDLASYLDVTDVASFDTRAEQAEMIREVQITTRDGYFTVDLTHHRASPLHSLWRAFLEGRDFPGPVDALNALERSALAFQAVA